MRTGAGALETLLAGWATALAARGHDVAVVGGRGTHGADERDAGVTDSAGVIRRSFDEPSDLGAVLRELEPEAVVINNRPGWQQWVRAPTLHLFHNWPDAWAAGRPDGAGAVGVGRAGLAAMSGALRAVVAANFSRRQDDVAVVVPFVGAEFVAVAADATPGLVLAPNRLLEKKGIRQLVRAAQEPSLSDRRILVSDFLSPWTSPTPEHEALRRVVLSAPNCELVPPAPSRLAMAAVYAAAEVAVVPSIHPEGFGMAAVEAQAVGVPVVSSGLGGLAESSLLPGLVVDPHDSDGLAAAIVNGAALGPEIRDQLRDVARRRWSLPASVDSLLAALSLAAPA